MLYYGKEIGKNDSPAKAWRVGTRYGLPRLRTTPWALHGPSRDVARGEIGGGLTAGIIAALLQLLVASRRPGHLRRPARRRRRARLNGEVDDSAAIGDM